MSNLKTPEKIREFQLKLYTKAKQEPRCRFHQLYDKVYRPDILEHAYRLSKANGGAPGVDGETFDAIEQEGLEPWLKNLEEELKQKIYRPRAVRRVMLPKPGGGERPLGIPVIRDRVVQTAVKLVIEPIFEADFGAEMYGYRPNRSAVAAVKEVHTGICQGYTEVVDADLEKYFDTIPHRELMYAVARRISDKHMLHLVKMWLKVPVQTKDDRGRPTMSGGKKSREGTPQGGVISPLLANIYLNRMVRAWQERGKPQTLQARLVVYADDLVILSKGKGQQAYEWLEWAMTKLGLRLNAEKTQVRNGRQESFDFLGYTFGPEIDRRDGHRYLAAQPSEKSILRLKDKVRQVLSPGNVEPIEAVVKRLNRILQGWTNYFSYGTRYLAYRTIDNYVAHRMRRFLCRRHKVRSRGIKRFSSEYIYGTLGMTRVRNVQLGPQRA